MSPNPFFSIVIVNYNHGNFIEDAIKSVLNQDCDDYELIIIDGGSTDQSNSVISSYKEYLSTYISERDKGQSDAFNKGFSIAIGKYYFWLNADDILLPGTLKNAKSYLLANPKCQWLAGNTVVFNNNMLIEWFIRGPVFNKWLVRYGTVYIYGPSSFFHKDLFKLSRGFDLDLHYTMDTDLWYQFLKLGYKFDRLDYYCWGFRVHNESKTSHALLGRADSAFEKEKKYIQYKNNHKILKVVELLQLLFKILTGCLVIRQWHNWKYKGKNVYEVFNV